MTSDTSDSHETSKSSKASWIDPRLLAALVAVITVPCAALLAVVAHVPQRTLTVVVFVIGFLAPVILLWNQDKLDRPVATKPPSNVKQPPAGDSKTSKPPQSSPSEENNVSVILDHDITVGRPLKLIIRSKGDEPT